MLGTTDADTMEARSHTKCFYFFVSNPPLPNPSPNGAMIGHVQSTLHKDSYNDELHASVLPAFLYTSPHNTTQADTTSYHNTQEAIITGNNTTAYHNTQEAIIHAAKTDRRTKVQHQPLSGQKWAGNSVCVEPSTYLKFKFLKWKWTSTIPVVLTRVLSISCSVGMQSLAPKRCTSSKKLQSYTPNTRQTMLVVYQQCIISTHFMR